MREIIFIVYDRVTRRMHIVGTNEHDCLDLCSDGTVAYMNYQNGDGSRCVEECVKDGVNEGYFLMQFTGLLDKNGTKIFEGDVLANRLNRMVDKEPFEVLWDEFSGGYLWRNADGADPFYDTIAKNSEVIGNIHDNPELLEVQDAERN